MLSSLTLAVVAAIAYIGYLIYKYRDNALGTSPRPDLKGPKGWPIIGNLPGFIKNGDKILHMFVDELQEFGLFSTVTIPGMRAIDVSRPDCLEYIQKTNFQKFAKGNFQADRMRDILGRGIFNVDGHEWYTQRKVTSHIFTAEAFRGVITSSIQQHVDHLHKVIERDGASGSNALALNDLFFRFTLDSFVAMAFGQDPNTLMATKSFPFAVAFDYAQCCVDKRFRNPLWVYTERFSATGRKMKEAIRTIDEYAYSVIDSRERALKSGDKQAENAKDLLTLYMNMRDEKGQPLSRVQLRDAVINLIIAGRDTSAQTLSWAFFALIKEPQYLQRMRQELKDVLGDEPVNYDNYKSLPTFLAVFSESLRLWPAVPKNGWTVLEDCKLPNDGPYLKKGEQVRWSDWQMARDQSIWGVDAAVFSPDRWLYKDEGGNLACKRESNFKAHGFNGGSRLCLGQNLATFEVIVIMATLVQRYDFAFDPAYLDHIKATGIDNAPMYSISLTLPMKDNLKVHLYPIKSD